MTVIDPSAGLGPGAKSNLLNQAADLVDDQITWVGTPEGGDFWSYVYERLREMARHLQEQGR